MKSQQDFMVSMRLSTRLHGQYAIAELNTDETSRDWQNLNLILYTTLWKIKPHGVFNAILWKLFSKNIQRSDSKKVLKYYYSQIQTMFAPSITGGEECHKTDTSVIEVVRVGQSIIRWQLDKH